MYGVTFIYRIDRSVERGYICSLQSLGTFFNAEFYSLTFHQVAKAITVDGSVVDEYIWAVLLGDETISLAAVEPIDCSNNTF